MQILAFAYLGLSVASANVGASTLPPSAAAVSKPSQAAYRRLLLQDEQRFVSTSKNVTSLRSIKEKVQAGGALTGVNGGWVELGPDNMAGPTRALIVHPNNPSILWQATKGGVWKSTDGGVSWSLSSLGITSLAISALAISRSNPNVLYAGTGDGLLAGETGGSGVGLFKSTDGGATWARLVGSETLGACSKLAVHPANPNVVLLSSATRGIFRSTNGGTSWTNVYQADIGSTVTFVPGNPDRVLAAVGEASGIPFSYNTKILLSTDGGSSWTAAGGALTGLVTLIQNASVEIAPANVATGIVYASISEVGVYRSADGGATFSRVAFDGEFGTSLDSNAIWTDGDTGTKVLIGGANVLRSLDSGATFTQISADSLDGPQPHVGVHALAQLGSSGLLVGTDGGVFQATDFTTASVNGGWSSLNHGVRSSIVRSAAWLSGAPNLFAATIGHGSITFDPATRIGQTFDPGDAEWIVLDPNNPALIYGSRAYLDLFRSRNGGTTVESMNSGLEDANWNANPRAPIVLDPNHPQAMYAGGASLWRCNDTTADTPTWQAVSAPNTDLINAVAVANGNSNVVWFALNDGRIAKSTNATDATPTWTFVDDNAAKNPLPDRLPTKILIDSSNSDTVYVTFGGYSKDNVWKTSDGGSTWVSASGDLPAVPVTSIARYPGDANGLFVGTQVGVFCSTNGGTNWTFPFGPNYVPITDLSFLTGTNTLLASTEGRGVWKYEARPTNLTSLSLNPGSVLGGTTSTGHVSLGAPTPVAATVRLSSNQPNLASVPASVTIPVGQSSADFTVSTATTATAQTVTISATSNGMLVSAPLTVRALEFTGLRADPSTVVTGNKARFVFDLNAPAPAGGLTLALKASSTAITVPTSITIPAGMASYSAEFTTKSVPSPTSVELTATFGTTVRKATVKLVTATLSGVSVSPSSFLGGASAMGTVKIASAAGAELTVALTSNNSSLTLPATVTIPKDATSATFPVTSKPVSTERTVTVSATLGAVTKTTTVTLQQITLSKLELSPNSVVGGSGTKSTATVTLSAPAGAGGLSVILSADPNSLVSMPASLLVPAGAKSATFQLTANEVSTQNRAAIRARVGTSTVSASYTINPYTVKGLTLSPAEVVGGASTTGTVTLTQAAGPDGITVKLSADSPASTPSSIKVPAGESSATFSIDSAPVSALRLVTVRASIGAKSATATLKLKPRVSVLTLRLSPNLVIGGSSTKVEGTVTLTAEAGDSVTVSISSSSSLVKTPTTVTIPKGKSSATFKIEHSKTTKTTVVTITAKGNDSIAKAATLTVNAK